MERKAKGEGLAGEKVELREGFPFLFSHKASSPRQTMNTESSGLWVFRVEWEERKAEGEEKERWRGRNSRKVK